MESNPHQKTQRPSRKKGCFIVLLVGAALAGLIFWQIGEPGRRAKRIHKVIQPGMTFKEIENLLTGRYFCDYQVATDSGWESIPRAEFIKRLESGTKKSVSAKRIWLTFLGTAPGRVSFFVEFDRRGRVLNVTEPYGWD